MGAYLAYRRHPTALVLIIAILICTIKLTIATSPLTITTSPIDQTTGQISIAGQIDCLHMAPYVCTKVREVHLNWRLGPPEEAPLTLRSFKLGLCSSEWNPTSEYFVNNNEVHTTFHDSELTHINPSITQFTAIITVDVHEMNQFIYQAHDLVFVMETSQPTGPYSRTAPITYTNFPLQQRQRDQHQKQQQQQQQQDQQQLQLLPQPAPSLVPIGRFELFDLAFANDSDPLTQRFWSGHIGTTANYTEILGVPPTHLNFTIFGQYILKIPQNVDTIDINGYQCRWKRFNMYTLMIELNKQLITDFQSPNTFTIRFPQTWFIDQSTPIFSCPTKTATLLTIPSHFILSLFNKDKGKIHFVRDFMAGGGPDVWGKNRDNNLNNHHPSLSDIHNLDNRSDVFDAGTQPLSTFSTSYSFYEPSTRFFFSVTAIDWAGSQQHFDPTQFQMDLNLSTNFDLSLDTNSYGKQRFDLLLARPESNSSTGGELGDDHNDHYLTFITPIEAVLERHWSLPNDLYPPDSTITDHINPESPHSKRQQLSKSLPRMLYHTNYGYLLPIAPITTQPRTTIELKATTQTQTIPTSSCSQWTSSPISSADPMPVSGVVLDTTKVTTTQTSSTRAQYELHGLRVLFSNINKSAVWPSAPKQLILTIPQPNLIFINTDLSSDIGPSCTWQYAALLNSDRAQVRGVFSWFASAPTSQKHWEWPPTEWASAKRLLVTFPDDLTFNPFTTGGGDAVLECESLHIITLGYDGFVTSGANFQYKNLGSWQFGSTPEPAPTPSPSLSTQDDNSVIYPTSNWNGKKNPHFDDQRHHKQQQQHQQQHQQTSSFTTSFTQTTSDDKQQPDPAADIILTTQFVMNSATEVFGVYQHTIIANFGTPVRVKSIDIDIFTAVKTVITVTIPLILFIIITFAIYQGVVICCSIRKQRQLELEKEKEEQDDGDGITHDDTPNEPSGPSDDRLAPLLLSSSDAPGLDSSSSSLSSSGSGNRRVQTSRELLSASLQSFKDELF